MDGEDFSARLDLIFTVRHARDGARLLGIAHEVQNLAVIQITVMDELGQVELVFLFGHSLGPPAGLIGRFCRLLQVSSGTYSKSMEELGSARSSYRPEILQGNVAQLEFERLLNDAFGVPSGRTFFDDFPVWDEQNGAEILRLGLRSQDGALAACSAMRFAHLWNGGQTRKVALIGCVASSQFHRGKGLATQVVHELLGRARRNGAAAAILFGTEEGLYSRLGFQPTGDQVRVPLLDLNLEAPAEGSPVGVEWVDSLFTLLQNRKSGLQLQASDRMWMQAHRHNTWWWWGLPTQPQAYACVDRGIDLGGFVHEWGGDPVALKKLLGFLVQIRPELTLLGNPFHLGQAGLLPPGTELEPMCLTLPLQPDFEWHGDTWLWGLDGA